MAAFFKHIVILYYNIVIVFLTDQIPLKIFFKYWSTLSDFEDSNIP